MPCVKRRALTYSVLVLSVQIGLHAPYCLGSLLSRSHLHSSVKPQPATHTAETHADTAALQQAAPLLLSLGRRELQQDLSPLPASVSSLSAPTTIAPKSIDVATPATATTTVPLTTPAVLPDDNLAPSTSPSTAGLNNSSAVDPPVATVSHEQAWPSFLPSDSPAPEIAVEITEAPFPASIPPAAVVNNDALAPEDSTTDDGTTTSLTTPPPPPPDEPAEEPAEEPTEEPLSLPPVAAPDARPATLVDSVFSNQIHQGRLRISVVIIIAALMVLCGLSACTLFISKRWYEEPDKEDDYPLSPRGDYFILKSRPGKQGVLVSHWDALHNKSKESMQGTLKSTLKKSLNNALSIPTSSMGGGSTRRTSNWGTGGIPATLGYIHTLPSAADALYSSGTGWGWGSGGRELGKDLYVSTTAAAATAEEDPNANTWPPATTRMTRILSVLPEGAEEDERLMSTFSQGSHLGPYGSFRRATATSTAAGATGIAARRCSDPFPVQLPPGQASAIRRDSHTEGEHDGGSGLLLTGADRSATARPTGSSVHSTSGPGAAPVLARICELGRMPSSEMTVLVDTSVCGSADNLSGGSLRYTGSHHLNQHSPGNQGISGATWGDRRASRVSQHAPRDTDVSGTGSNPDVIDDLTSCEGSWHSMHSTKRTLSKVDSTSDTPCSDRAPSMHATETGANDLGLQLQALHQQGSASAERDGQTASVSPRDPRQPMHAKRQLQLAQTATDHPSPRSGIFDNAIFDRLFSGPEPEMPAGTSRQLEAVSSLGAGSGNSTHTPLYQVHASESFPHPEPSAEPSRMSSKHASSARTSRTPHRDYSRAVSAVPGAGTTYAHGLQNTTFARNCSAAVAAGVQDTQHQRSQLNSESWSRSSQREQARRESWGVEGVVFPDSDALQGSSTAAAAAAAGVGHAADRTDSAGTQSSWEAEAIAKQAAEAWRSGRAQEGSSVNVRNTSSVVHNGGRSGGSTSRRLGHEPSGSTQRQSGRVLQHSSSMAASVNIRKSLALREQRVVQASRDPLCFSRRPRRRSHVGNSHTACALRNVIASTAAAPDDAQPHHTSAPPQNCSISPRFRHSVAAISGYDNPPAAVAQHPGHTAPFPSVPVSDYALTWLSKVRLSQGDAAGQPPPTHRTTDTALSARGRDESSEHDQDHLTASALPSPGYSSRSDSAGGATTNGNNGGRWGAAPGGTRTPRGSSNTHAKDPEPVAFGSSHIPPHIIVSTDAHMPRTASFGCQVEPQMVARETGATRSVGVAVGPSVTGSLASTSMPSMLGSSAAPSPMGPPSYPLRATLPTAPSNASNMHTQNASATRTSADTVGACSDVATPTSTHTGRISPAGTHTTLQRGQSDARAPWASITKSGSGSESVLGQGNHSTLYGSVRSDTLATESAMHDDMDAARQLSYNSQADNRLGGAMMCAVCSAGMHVLEAAGSYNTTSSQNRSGLQKVPGECRCENCGNAIDAEQLGDGADQEGVQTNTDSSDMLPLLSADGGHGHRGVSDSQNGIGGATKNVVQASIDSVRSSYGFVALGALAERCLRTSNGSLRNLRKSHRATQNMSHSSDSSISDSRMSTTYAQRDSLLCSMDCSVSISNHNSVATSAATRAEVVQGSPELPSVRSARSTSVTLALLPDSSPTGVGGDTADSSAVARVTANAPSIELSTTAMRSHAAAVYTAGLGPSWASYSSKDIATISGGAQDSDAVHRSAPVLSPLELLSPSPSPDAMAVHSQSAGARVQEPHRERKWPSTRR